jgi:hypothetical protein
MTAKVFLRIAAGAITIFELGHTLGGMIFTKSNGVEDDIVIEALKAYRVDMPGNTRSHYDFYIGEGWYLSATLATMIAVCWLLSSAATESPALVRRLSLVISLFFAGSVVLCAVFFFPAPLVMSAIASSGCAAAWWRLKSA